MIEGQEGAAAEQETTVEPILEVEAIDFPVDGDSAIMDQEGRVVSAVSPEGKRVYLKGSAAANEAKGTKTKPAGADEGNNPNSPAPNTEGDEAQGDESGQGGAGDEEAEFENHAHYILKAGGYEEEEVLLGEGVKKKLSELTPDEQLDIITDEYDRVTEEHKAEITKLKNEIAKLGAVPATHKEIIEYLKNGGDLQQLAKEIISKDPAAQAKIMTDDDVVRASIKKQFPTMSDEDIEAELKELSDPAKARRAKAYRAQMEKEGPDLKNLTAAQKQQQQAVELAARAEYDKSRTVMIDAIKKVDQIAGMPLNNEIKNFLLRETIPSKPGEDSKFVKEILANPGLIMELRFLKEYAANQIQAAEKFHYERGLKEGRKGLAKLPEEKVLRQFSTITGAGKKPVVQKNVEDMTQEELDKFLASE